jgi:hypothetical protein
MNVRYIAVFLASVAAATSATASPNVLTAGAAIVAARKSCWEEPGADTPTWHARIANGHFDAHLVSKVWHVRLIEPSTGRKCPTVDATVTADGGEITCTLELCENRWSP